MRPGRTATRPALALRSGLRPQEVEPPELVFDRQRLAAREAGLRGVAADRRLADDRPRPCRAFADHPDGKAVEEAEAVIEALDLAGGRGELVLGALVADQHDAVLGQRLASSLQHGDGI